MIDPALLRIAVERGIISHAQAHALGALEHGATPAHLRPYVDDENVRLVSGFGDIFVTIGLGLFLSSIGYFARLAAGDVASWGSIALVSWGLAEFFTRRRHMALPSIALLAAFAGAAFMTLTELLAGLLAGATRAPSTGRGWLANALGLDLSNPAHVAAASLLTAALIALHFRRFRVPVSIAAGSAAVAGAFVSLLQAVAPEHVRAHANALLFVCGVALFALAMRFDLADPNRMTRRTDAAFWLHLVAAPLIVHPLVAPFVRGDETRDLASAGLVLAVVLALGLVALVIDRRAMLVSGLTYAGIAIGTIVGRSGIDVDRILPATLFGLGAFVLLASALWQPLRAVLIARLPVSLARHLAPPRPISGPPGP